MHQLINTLGSLPLVLLLLSTSVSSEPVALNGLEIECGRVNMYFGDQNIYYSSPSLSDFEVSNSSILDGSSSNQIQLKITYGDPPLLVRQTGCLDSDIFCQKEFISGNLLSSHEALLVHRKSIEFFSTPDADPGIAWQFLLTLMNHRITVRSGYTAEFVIRQRVAINQVLSSYEYTDSLGNQYRDNLWEDWRHEFQLDCKAL